MPAIFRRSTFEEMKDWIHAFRSYAAQGAVILILAIRRYSYVVFIPGPLPLYNMYE